MTDGTGTSTYSYDGFGRLTSQVDGAGQAVGYGYDLAGNLTSLTYPNNKTVTRGYDAASRLTSITDWVGHTTTLTPDPDGNTTTEVAGNGVTATSTFDSTDRLAATTDTAPSGTVLASLSYTRDANHQLTSTNQSGVPGGNESYSYTQLEQLGGVNSASYSYDPAGNLTKLLNGDTLSYDAANQPTSYTPAGGTATSVSYDSSGRRTAGPTASGGADTYAYDQANRLTSAESAGNDSGAARMIAAGQYHSLALDSSGTVWAWGYNAYGQLGNGTTTSTSTPIKVPGAAAGSAVSAGLLSSVELTRTGTVSAWGNNGYGQLGNGTTTSSGTPVTVAGLSGIRQVAAGNYHVLAIRADGTVAAWGLNNAGQLGDGSTTTRTSPVTVPGVSGVVQVAAGGLPGYAGHSVALKSDGTVWTWGYGKSGQLGLGTATSTPTPTKVSGLPAIAQIAANGDDTYAVGKDGSLWAWGDDSYGQIGNTAASKAQASPIKVSLSSVTSVGAGGTHALALTTDGAAWAWGNDNTGQLGDGGACGKTCPAPVKVSGLTGVAALTGGYVHSLAVMADGTVRAWGRNAEGELGDGTTTVRTTPVTTNGVTGIKPVHPTTYTYDGDGLRATRNAGQSTQHFAWQVGAVPQLLTDGVLSYLYDDSGLPVEQIDATGVSLYYQHDQYGSTRLLTDGAGAIAASFSYDPYGKLTGQTGTADTPLRWNGQYQDADTGLYYLRARYYDPLTAQFLTRDPLVSITLSPYGYAGQSPLLAADPLGLDPWNPFSWTGKTWAAVGTGVALVAVGVATFGVGDVVIAGGAAAAEVTVDATATVAADAAVDSTVTVTATAVDEGGVTLDQAVTATGRLVAAGATARGGYDTYQCINSNGSWVTCGMDATATIMSALDPFLGLSAGNDFLYNFFGLEWANATPEGEGEC